MNDLWRWLLTVAQQDERIDSLFFRFCAELCRRGLPLWRATLGLEILHPEISGSFVVWSEQTEEAREADRSGLKESDEYMQSPTRLVDETGMAFHLKLDAPVLGMPLMTELRDRGATGYVMYPLPFRNRSRTAAMSFATRQKGGFDPSHEAALADAMQLFSPYAEREVLGRIAVDLMATYVGPRTGRRVIGGAIERGAHETIEAAIWHADLRGFTHFSEIRPTAEVIAVLNEWLEEMVHLIEGEGGEVLKFIGDGVLAIFPRSAERDLARSSAAALRAARAFCERRRGGPGLEFGLALHVGEVAYGNIGAARRLDFTVIGPAVNRAARLQEVGKQLGQSLVLSSAFSRLAGQPVEELGCFALRGIECPERVFGLPKVGRSNLSSMGLESCG
ncbi:MAG TPA: adenylate/guanylate cyclase domain-containing protein [Microvirga sp.]|jgi:adenylate cyclase|nr:adenylate/guanylate cyclase domain-containing protein [Microvirga sp.]